EMKREKEKERESKNPPAPILSTSSSGPKLSKVQQMVQDMAKKNNPNFVEPKQPEPSKVEVPKVELPKVEPPKIELPVEPPKIEIPKEAEDEEDVDDEVFITVFINVINIRLQWLFL